MEGLGLPDRCEDEHEDEADESESDPSLPYPPSPPRDPIAPPPPPLPLPIDPFAFARTFGATLCSTVDCDEVANDDDDRWLS